MTSIFRFPSLFLLIIALAAGTAEAATSNAITAIKTEESAAGYNLKISGESPPTYAMYELYEPLRIILDIADTSLSDTLGLPLILSQGPVAQVKGQQLEDQQPVTARIEILLAEDRDYSVERQDNVIVVKFSAAPAADKITAAPETKAEGAPATEKVENNPPTQHLPALETAAEAQTSSQESPPAEVSADVNSEAMTSPEALPEAKVSTGQRTPDSFTFAGYTKDRITVDFFKIDIHNVFRLIGEISGLNIVVDSGVSGTVTLALNDIPWDFALDIIMNMHDLQKEERFNTIIISPKSKSFSWPKKATENISFKAEGTIEKIEAITITKRLETSPREVEAKKLMHEAYAKDKNQEFEAALALYEKAFEQWPENRQLANKISSLCLVNLKQNAKAVHYAQAALKIDPLDSNSALHAAIGLANMKKNADAKEYFELAVSVPKPSNEALVSYAVFCEQTAELDKALTLLAKNEDNYGDTLESMIAKARIFDKMGNTLKATEEYRAVLLSGFELEPDLKRYITGRLSF